MSTEAPTKTQRRRTQRQSSKKQRGTKGSAPPPRPDKSQTECVYITPAIAKKWLVKNTKNRPLAAQKLAELKQVLELGLFTVNGETIKFDEDGVLRDGQTRLHAIAETGIAAWCWVCTKISRECFDTIDQGRARNLGQLLAVRQKRNYNNLAMAIKIVYQFSEEIAHEPGGFVPRIGLQIIEAKPEIEVSLDFVTQHGIRDAYSAGTAGGLHYLMRQVDQELADRYWEALGTGVITNQRSPLKAVRDTLLTNKMANGDNKHSPTVLMAIVIKGWNLMRKGRTCKYIRWNGCESFPTIE